MKVLVVGGGRLGSSLVGALTSAGHAVAVIEKNEARAESLAAEFPEAVVVNGDGDDPSTLESAHIAGSEVVAAMTDEDEDNLVACLLAAREYGVQVTLARVNDRRNEWLFGGRFGVGHHVSASGFDATAVVERLAGLL